MNTPRIRRSYGNRIQEVVEDVGVDKGYDVVTDDFVLPRCFLQNSGNCNPELWRVRLLLKSSWI